jgi:hypothetical protein
MSKKHKADFNNMSMLTFNRAILLMSMWARDKVGNTNMIKEGTELLAFTALVGLHG